MEDSQRPLPPVTLSNEGSRESGREETDGNEDVRGRALRVTGASTGQQKNTGRSSQPPAAPTLPFRFRKGQ